MQGTVKNAQGQAVAGAQVEYRRVVQLVRTNRGVVPAPGEAIADNVVTTNASGVFSATGLPLGDYTLCVSVPSSTYLNPCIWQQPTLVAVSTGAAATPVITLSMGVYLNVRVNDPLKLLPQAVDGAFTVRQLVVGVT